MKIAIVSNTRWSVYNFRLGLLNHLSMAGSRVTILSPKDTLEQDHRLIPNVKEKCISLNRRSLNPIKDLRLCLQLLLDFKKSQYDCVINYTIKPAIYSSLVCRVLRIPCITVITGLGFSFNRSNSLLRKVVEILYRVSLKSTSHILFLNQDDLDIFRNSRLIPESSGRVLPSEGVNTRYFSLQPIATREKTKFLFIGRFLRDKGIEDYANAARVFLTKRNDAEFSILGSIDPDNPASINKDSVNKWVQEGIINDIGFVSDVREAIKSHHCIVLPSYYREGIPRSLLESLSMGRIIITTRNVGCREVLEEDKNGFHCKERSPSSLVEAFEKVYNLSNSELSNMGLSGRKFVQEKFSEDFVVNIYQELIHGGSTLLTKN